MRLVEDAPRIISLTPSCGNASSAKPFWKSAVSFNQKQQHGLGWNVEMLHGDVSDSFLAADFQFTFSGGRKRQSGAWTHSNPPVGVAATRKAAQPENSIQFLEQTSRASVSYWVTRWPDIQSATETEHEA